MTLIRAKPSTRLSVIVESPDGAVTRWGIDERRTENVPNNLSFSSTMPGGFEQMSCTLERDPAVDYADLAEFSTVTVVGAGGETAWQGRLETSPRTSGDQRSVTPGAVGFQAALDDDKSARMIYIDIALNNWGGVSTNRQLALLNGGVDSSSAGVSPAATSGLPSLVTQLTGPWSRESESDGWYDAKGLPLAAIWGGWTLQSPGNIGDDTSTDPAWAWGVGLSDDDRASAYDISANLRAAGPGTVALAATSATRKWAFVQLVYGTAGGNNGVNYPVFWTYLAVFGRHGIAVRGALTSTGGVGVLASDVIQHAVNTWASSLSVNKAGVSTIEGTSLVIPHLAFPDPTTASDIITQALAYELMDWWVDEGPTFNLASRANHGRDWQARVGPAGLQETGPQVERIANRVIVAYNDTSGATRTVGPAGSSADTIDGSLADMSSTNPATAAGLVIYPPNVPNIGTSTTAGAVAYGQRLLQEMQAANTSGQAQITGHVQDLAGVWWPAWAIRAGDRITFVDSHDPTPRRITRAQYTDSSKACQIDLDSPAQDLDVLLSRMTIATKALGL